MPRFPQVRFPPFANGQASFGVPETGRRAPLLKLDVTARPIADDAATACVFPIVPAVEAGLPLSAVTAGLVLP